MRKGNGVRKGVRRTTIGLCALALIVVFVREMPAMRRYLKAGTT
ncbi:MAG TPA: hypothetical protein VIL71_03735 [Spirillospora sp.]